MYVPSANKLLYDKDTRDVLKGQVGLQQRLIPAHGLLARVSRA